MDKTYTIIYRHVKLLISAAEFHYSRGIKPLVSGAMAPVFDKPSLSFFNTALRERERPQFNKQTHVIFHVTADPLLILSSHSADDTHNLLS